MIGIVALSITAGAMRHSPVLSRFVSSAQSVRQNFCDFRSLSPIERFVFSVVLAESRTEAANSRT